MFKIPNKHGYTCPILMEITRILYRLVGKDAKWKEDATGISHLVIGHSRVYCIFPKWMIRLEYNLRQILK